VTKWQKIYAPLGKMHCTPYKHSENYGAALLWGVSYVGHAPGRDAVEFKNATRPVLGYTI
ncbi:hypothetical protein, partial [Salmonella sp. s60131]|uniref:hypothetical protein n=1 Tax=Salmonella sp. s60131 TaxID=3159722 RepID=UPI003980DB2B